MKRILFFLISIIALQSLAFAGDKVTVAVAANAQYAMKAIEKQYEKETGKEVELIIGSSGKFIAQIKEGAPFDIFLSADMDYPNALAKDGFTIGEPKVYAYGSLVLWTMKDIELLNIKVLLLNDVKNVAIANPKLAPYGVAAESVLNYYKIYDKVQPKIVYGESISQVNQYVSSKTADIGFTARSVVDSPEMQGKGKWIAIDKKAYQPIEQGAVLLKGAKHRNKADAEKFYNYLFSDNAQKIFKKYGYQFKK